MTNIEEDSLKRVNIIIEKTKAYDNCVFPIGTRGEFGALYISDLKGLLSELETYKKANDNLLVKNVELKIELKTLEQSNKNLLVIKTKLETWKKIAERLAKRVDKLDEENYNYCQSGETHCKETNRCIQCIIDWARKEVEKE